MGVPLWEVAAGFMERRSAGGTGCSVAAESSREQTCRGFWAQGRGCSPGSLLIRRSCRVGGYGCKGPVHCGEKTGAGRIAAAEIGRFVSITAAEKGCQWLLAAAAGDAGDVVRSTCRCWRVQRSRSPPPPEVAFKPAEDVLVESFKTIDGRGANVQTTGFSCLILSQVTNVITGNPLAKLKSGKAQLKSLQVAAAYDASVDVVVASESAVAAEIDVAVGAVAVESVVVFLVVLVRCVSWGLASGRSCVRSVQAEAGYLSVTSPWEVLSLERLVACMLLEPSLSSAKDADFDKCWAVL
ncbi:hypothetical protein MLD38_006138 [Melastoma candidum]|uniref:Uncharacterized protein n=1 Tax=Melastoma candidum TaxID=119954 RepID=A0ACB9RM09_9MYRT|nr:hypothetical protein MLD38_006138 [Melastoma candidum]